MSNNIIDLKKIAAQRENLHKNHASSRPLSKNYEYLGLKGEAKFSEEFEIPMDNKLRPSGDGGRDFPSVLGNIDVKTARKAFNLLVEVGKVVSDVYVLAKYTDKTDEVEPIAVQDKTSEVGFQGHTQLENLISELENVEECESCAI